MIQPARIRLTLELEPDADAVCGVLLDGRGAGDPFARRMGLAAQNRAEPRRGPGSSHAVRGTLSRAASPSVPAAVALALSGVLAGSAHAASGPYV